MEDEKELLISFCLSEHFQSSWSLSSCHKCKLYCFIYKIMKKNLMHRLSVTELVVKTRRKIRERKNKKKKKKKKKNKKKKKEEEEEI